MLQKSSIVIIGAAGTVGREVLIAAWARGIYTRFLDCSKVRAVRCQRGYQMISGFYTKK
mgnify:CR=1 FL=1